MPAKIHQYLALFFVAVGVACGDPNDMGDDQSTNPFQTGDGGLYDAGAIIPPAFDAGGHVDAGATPLHDAGSPADAAVGFPWPDAGIFPGFDAGSVVGADAGHDAGNDAGHDAGTPADAGGDAASGCALTYDSFGKQFMTMYCVSCHAGLFASHGVQLDSLAGVKTNKAAVKREAVTSTAMPQANPKPTAAERQQLGQWLDCGPN